MKKATAALILMTLAGAAQAGDDFQQAARLQRICNTAGDAAVIVNHIKHEGQSKEALLKELGETTNFQREVIYQVYVLDVDDMSAHALGRATCMDRVGK